MMQVLSTTTALLLLTTVVVVDANRMAFHFDGMDHAGCKSGTFDMELKRLKFLCNGGENLCRPGDLVTVEGHCKFVVVFFL